MARSRRIGRPSRDHVEQGTRALQSAEEFLLAAERDLDALHHAGGPRIRCREALRRLDAASNNNGFAIAHAGAAVHQIPDHLRDDYRALSRATTALRRRLDRAYKKFRRSCLCG